MKRNQTGKVISLYTTRIALTEKYHYFSELLLTLLLYMLQKIIKFATIFVKEI